MNGRLTNKYSPLLTRRLIEALAVQDYDNYPKGALASKVLCLQMVFIKESGQLCLYVAS
jgi:hypothetical protein